MRYNLAKKDWQLPSQNYTDNQKAFLKEAGNQFSPAFLRLVVQRGIESLPDLKEFIQAQPQLFHDPHLLHEMDVAVERIQQAIIEQEAILVYGDYDADGITSTLILSEALESLGARVEVYLPDRFADGYGPNPERYQAFIDQGIQLIITCDNGVAGFDALALAKEAQVDVIVTDHHQIQDRLPEAYAIIHPCHPEGTYPFSDLSGAGVALKLASALLDEVPAEALELAMIGTIADMVSLTDENRTIVKSGLSLLKHSQRPGIIELLKRGQVELDDLDEETIGFIIGPRLNAMGRLANPRPAYDLLATHQAAEASLLADLLEKTNQQRQDIVNQIMTEIEAELEGQALPNIIIAADANWPAGVLGIAAGRLCQTYQRPVLLFQYFEDRQEYKGSGRSTAAIHLFNILKTQEPHLKYFGGHAQAAGMTVTETNWSVFKSGLEETMLAYQEQLAIPPSINIDLVLRVEELTVDFIQEMNLLGPFGMDNAKPLILLGDVELESVRFLGNDSQHLKLNFTNQDKSAVGQAIGFHKADQGEFLNEGQKISLVGQASINQFRNQSQAQIVIEDLGIRGQQWIDWRSSTVDENIFQFDQALYLFTSQTLLTKYQEHLLTDSRAILLNEQTLESQWQDLENLVIFQLPKRLEDLQRILENHSWRRIILASYHQGSKYLAGNLTYQSVKKFYLWQMSQEAYPIRTSLPMISTRLNIPVIQLKVLIMMFFEAGFVTIKDGWIQNIDPSQHEKIDIFSLPSYQTYLASLEAEALLNFQPLQVVKEYFEGKKIND